MGLGGLSIGHLLVLLLVVVLVFGTKRLRNMGGDLGAAIKGFRKGMEEEKNGTAERLEADQIGADATPSSSTRESAAKDSAKSSS